MNGKIHCTLAVMMASQRPPINQTELKSATGLAGTTINRLYNNTFTRVDTTTLVKLCEYFDCEIADLFVYEKEENSIDTIEDTQKKLVA